MDSKDAGESLERGGCGARCRCSNGRRNSAAVLVIHSLLIAACAALSLNVYLNQSGSNKHFSQDAGIYMQMKMRDSDELKFNAIWHQAVELKDEKRMNLSCAGPYMVYLRACMRNTSNEAFVNLTMEQGTKSFHLQTLQGTECKEMQKVIMLSEKDEVKVKGYVKNGIKIRVFLGLHYMLGAQCFPHPLPHEQFKQLEN